MREDEHTALLPTDPVDALGPSLLAGGDTRTTGEHRFDLTATSDEPDILLTGRLADLTAQINFLEHEITRYRDLLEGERVRHSTEMADMTLTHDQRIDDLGREERRHTQALHDSYRDKMAARQVAHEAALTAATADHAAELDAERQQYEERLAQELDRLQAQLESAHRLEADEAAKQHRLERKAIETELSQIKASFAELQTDAQQSADSIHETNRSAVAKQRELERALQQAHASEHEARAQVHELTQQVASATRRLDAERKRSAATLSDLLKRSASLASEADQARSDFVAQLAAVQHTHAVTLANADRSYAELVAQADARTSSALERESELEALIAELSYRLNDS